MAWDKNLPDGSDPVSQGDDAIRANNTSLEDALSAEHYFPENADAAKHGRHKFLRGTTTARDAAITSPDDGNIAFEVDSAGNPIAVGVYDNGAWQRFAVALIGEVRMVAFDPTTPPAGWLECNGQEVSRTTYAALFTKIGTNFGVGNGTTTFNLPDFRSRMPMGFHSGGDGDGDHGTIGDTGGEKEHTLTIDEIPSHEHNTDVTSRTASPGGLDLLQPLVSGGSDVMEAVGGGQAHENRPQFVVVGYLIHAGL